MRRNKGRDVNGILLLDKTIAYSSNQALQRIKRLFFAKKAGHTGSLDPLATGMLPICFGRATKFSHFLLNSNKVYETVATLGVTTKTGDGEGEVTSEQEVPSISDIMLEDVLAKFRGEIEQMPPMYSALKHQGQPLYKLARQGITVERPVRVVTIHNLQLISRTPTSLTLTIECTKGTYIRTLVEDIGKALGCGAHVSALRRLSVSPYADHSMYRLEDLQTCFEESGFDGLDRFILPIETALNFYPKIEVSAADHFYLKTGKSLPATFDVQSGFVRLYLSGRCLGVGEITDGRLFVRRSF